MSVSVIGTPTSVVGTGPVTVTVPTGVAAGDLLILFAVSHDSAITPSIAFTNFTYTGGWSGGAFDFIQYRTVTGTEGSSFTVNNSFSTYLDCVCVAVRGQDTTTPLSNYANGTGFSNVIAIPTTTASSAGSLWLQLAGQLPGTTGTLSGSTPSGSTAIAELTDNANIGQLGAYYKAVNAGATGTVNTGAFPSSQSYKASSLIVNPAPSGVSVFYLKA
jgi:hypothetical protein